MNKKTLLTLCTFMLWGCGKNVEMSSSVSDVEDSLNLFLAKEKGVEELGYETTSFEVLRIEDLDHLENEAATNLYLENLNKKELRLKLTKKESLAETGCFSLNKDDAEIQLISPANSKLVKLRIDLKNTVSPVTVRCPINIDDYTDIRSYTIFPDLYITKENHEALKYLGTEKRKYDHLVFNLDETIYIKDINIFLNAQKVISFGTTTFSNFKETNKTQLDTDGRNGGNVSLSANQGMGSFIFNFNGEDGGRVTFLREKNPTLIPDDPTLDGDCKKSCYGRPGRQGLRGYQGFPGKRGGDAGSVKIRITNSLNMDIEIYQTPGKGSLGGEGGEGGVGQNGGFNKTPSYAPPERYPVKNMNHYMRSAGRAPQGPQGPKGAQGEKGQDGSLPLNFIAIDNFYDQSITTNFSHFFEVKL